MLACRLHCVTLQLDIESTMTFDNSGDQPSAFEFDEFDMLLNIAADIIVRNEAL